MKFLMFFVLSLCIGLNFACSSNDSSESNLPAITKKPIVIVNPTSRLANQDRGGSSRMTMDIRGTQIKFFLSNTSSPCLKLEYLVKNV